MLNVSLQVGDTAYFVSNANINALDFSTDSPTKIGPISGIGEDSITVNDADVIAVPEQGDFIMFSKDKLANNTSLIGYYAEVKLKNNSEAKAELFALSSEIAQSSK